MTKDDQRLLGQFDAKLDELHADIKELKVEVTALKEDFIRRQLVYKIALWFVGALAGLVGWIMQHMFGR